MSLEFAGKQTLPIPIEDVWAYLLNVKKVATCAPGAQSLQEIAPERWKAVVNAVAGPAKATFTIDITRSDLQAPEYMALKGHGNAPGSTVDASGEMRLKALTPDSTQMDWHASVTVSGVLANIGVQLLKGTIEKLTGQFFECLKRSMQAFYRRW